MIGKVPEVYTIVIDISLILPEVPTKRRLEGGSYYDNTRYSLDL